MKSEFWGLGIIVIVLVAGLGLAKYVTSGHEDAEMSVTGPVAPADVTAGNLTLSGYWVAESIGTQANTAGYVTIANASDVDDRLTACSTAIANMCSIHRTVTEDGMSRMEPLNSIIVPAGSEAHLAPGGLHMMIMGLTGPVTAGEEVELTLSFLEQGDVTLTLPVRSRAEMMDAGAMNMDHSGH